MAGSRCNRPGLTLVNGLAGEKVVGPRIARTDLRIGPTVFEPKPSSVGGVKR